MRACASSSGAKRARSDCSIGKRDPRADWPVASEVCHSIRRVSAHVARVGRRPPCAFRSRAYLVDGGSKQPASAACRRLVRHIKGGRGQDHVGLLICSAGCIVVLAYAMRKRKQVRRITAATHVTRAAERSTLRAARSFTAAAGTCSGCCAEEIARRACSGSRQSIVQF